MQQNPRPCPNCGRAATGDARFCSNCGGQLQAVEHGAEPSGDAAPGGGERNGGWGLLGSVAVVALLVGGAALAAVFVSGRLGSPGAAGGLTASATESPAPTSTLATPALRPSPAPVTPEPTAEAPNISAPAAPGIPDGYAVKYCAAYGTYNSHTQFANEGLLDDFRNYTAGIMTARQVVRAIDSYEAGLVEVDKAFARLPAWEPAQPAVAEFRKALAAYKTALGHFSKGMKTGSQAEFDRGTSAISAISNPMTAGYSGVIKLADDYGLRCSEEGLLLDDPGAGPVQGGALGQTVKVPGQKVVVDKVETWNSDSFMQPDPGNEYLTVYMEIEATGETWVQPITSKIKATDNTTYDPIFVVSRDPALDSGPLAKGQKVAGWVTFEVPSNLRNGLVLLWEYDLGKPAVEIALG